MVIRWSVKVIYCYGDLVPRHGELFEGKEEEGGRLYIIIIIIIIIIIMITCCKCRYRPRPGPPLAGREEALS